MARPHVPGDTEHLLSLLQVAAPFGGFGAMRASTQFLMEAVGSGPEDQDSLVFHVISLADSIRVFIAEKPSVTAAVRIAKGEGHSDDSPMQMAFFYLAVSEHISWSLYTATGLASFIDGLIFSGKTLIKARPDPDSIRTALGLPEITTAAAMLAYIKPRKAELERTLCKLAERLAQEIWAFVKERETAARVVTVDEAEQLTRRRSVPRPAAPISFIHHDRVRVKLHVRNADVASPVQAPTRPTLPSNDPAISVHRDRADRLEVRVGELEQALARVQRSASDDPSTEEQLRALNRQMRARIRALTHALDQQREGVAPVVTPSQPQAPAGWDQLKAFADRELAGRVVVTPKAMRAAKASPYEDIGFVWSVLQMLANDYLAMRRGEEGAKARFEDRCTDLRVRVALTGAAVDHHRTKAAYSVNHFGKSYTLDLHVQGSSSRDPREGFRLYFTVLDAEGPDPYILVGSMPTHLDSTLS